MTWQDIKNEVDLPVDQRMHDPEHGEQDRWASYSRMSKAGVPVRYLVPGEGLLELSKRKGVGIYTPPGEGDHGLSLEDLHNFMRGRS